MLYKENPRWADMVTAIEETGSILEYAKLKASEGAGHGSCFMARRQTNGRGRLGRVWLSPEGGLYITIILRPEKLQKGLSLAIALWISEFLESETGKQAEVIWPNDIYFEGKKICGILLEGAYDGDKGYIAAGIGINLNSEVSDEGRNPEGINPVSVFELTGRKFNSEHFLEDLLDHLQFSYESLERFGFNGLIMPLSEKCGMIGSKAVITENGISREIKITGIGPEGELEAESDIGPERIWNCDKIRKS